jgi:hypothetical protein
MGLIAGRPSERVTEYRDISLVNGVSRTTADHFAIINTQTTGRELNPVYRGFSLVAHIDVLYIASLQPRPNLSTLTLQIFDTPGLLQPCLASPWTMSSL